MPERSASSRVAPTAHTSASRPTLRPCWTATPAHPADHRARLPSEPARHHVPARRGHRHRADGCPRRPAGGGARTAGAEPPALHHAPLQRGGPRPRQRKSITDIRQLEGKKVNIDKPGSGTNLTARLIFEKLGIKPEFVDFRPVHILREAASGEIAAALYVAGRPVRAISEFQGDGRFHLLDIPFEGEIAESYFPATFTRADYPRLVA